MLTFLISTKRKVKLRLTGMFAQFFGYKPQYGTSWKETLMKNGGFAKVNTIHPQGNMNNLRVVINWNILYTGLNNIIISPLYWVKVMLANFSFICTRHHDSCDGIPAVLWTAASIQSPEAMVGCVHRLPLCNHAHDWCLWMHASGQ